MSTLTPAQGTVNDAEQLLRAHNNGEALDAEAVAALRAEHARELAAARSEGKAAQDAMQEMRLRHDALSKTLKHLQAEHRALAEDHHRLTIVIDAQARANAEVEARAETEGRAQLDRALRLSTPIGTRGSTPTARLREEIMLTAQELGNKAASHERERPDRYGNSGAAAAAASGPYGTTAAHADSERRRASRSYADRMAGSRIGTPAAAPQQPPLLPPRPSSRAPTDLAERLRQLEGSLLPDEAAQQEQQQLREEAASLRRELERREREAAQREEEFAKALAELRGALTASETRRLSALAEAEKQQTVLRHQLTAARTQLAADRRVATYGTQPDHGASTSPHAHVQRAGPRPRTGNSGSTGALGGAKGDGDLAMLVSEISARMARKGIQPYDDDDDDAIDDGGMDDDELAAQMSALAARRSSLGLASRSTLQPRTPMHGSGFPSGRDLHARLAQLDTNHSAILQLKNNVRANANRPRRPTADIAVRAGLDPAAGMRRKTIATLRTRLEQAKGTAASYA